MEKTEYIVYATSNPFMNFGLFTDVDKAYDGRLKAENYCEENANECRNKISLYPEQADFFKKRTEEYEQAFLTMTVSTWDEYEKAMRERILDKEPTKTTEEVYHRQMDVLPPLNWCECNNVVMFCMREFYWGQYTTQYAHDRITDKYYYKMVDAYDKSTWIYKDLRKEG